MNTNKLKATGSLTCDVILALCHPDKQSENLLVRSLFRFLSRPIMVENVEAMEMGFAKVDHKNLSAVIDEVGKLIREYERKLLIAASICAENPSKNIREFFTKEALDHFLVILLPIYAIAYKERIKRINSIRDKQAYNIGSALAAQVHLRDKNPTFMRRVDSILSEALGIKYTSEIDKALENDKARLARAIRGIYENKRTVVEDNYNKFVKSACDSKLGNLTESEIIETMVNGEANFEFSHLPYKVFQRSIDQLTPAVRIRQLRYRLKKRGFSEEERKRITDQEWHQFYNAIPTSFQENKEKKGTERIVEFTKRDEFKESAEACMVEFMKSLFPQAKSQKRVGKFLIEKLEAGKIGEYIRSNDRGFRIKEIHKDSGIPLRTIKRFCKELKEFANQKL